MRPVTGETGETERRTLSGEAFFIAALKSGIPRSEALCGLLQHVAKTDFPNLEVEPWYGDQAPGSIVQSIVRKIAEAPVIFADLTGASANVYYEVGMAHSLRRPVVAFIEGGEAEPQFDLGGDRAIRVQSNEDGSLKAADSIKSDVRKALKAIAAGKYSRSEVEKYLDEREGEPPIPGGAGEHDLRLAALRNRLVPVEMSELHAGLQVVHVEQGPGMVTTFASVNGVRIVAILFENGNLLDTSLPSDSKVRDLFHAPV
jgi:hypothetical protein